MSPLVKFIILSTALVKAGAFLSLPFLTIYLQNQFGASPVLTGIIIGLGPIASMIVGFYGGYLSDKCGRKHILLGSALICGLTFLSFCLCTRIWHFGLANLILGAASGALQTTLRALVSDLTHPNKRASAFRLHYFAINVGASLGPLVGAALLLGSSTLGFVITGTLYLLFFVTFIVFDKFTVNTSYQQSHSTITFKDCAVILVRDSAFLLFILGNILMSLTYSQIDTLLPQYLNKAAGKEGIKIYSWLLATNSITVMLGLYPVIWAAKKMKTLSLVIWGQIIMGLGFALMAFMGTSAPLLILCMIFLTIGEVLSFSNWNVVIDEFAKDGLKGSYFGASSFGMVGNSIGPVIGGLLYQRGGTIFAFNLLGLISILGSLLYVKANKIKIAKLEF